MFLKYLSTDEIALIDKVHFNSDLILTIALKL